MKATFTQPTEFLKVDAGDAVLDGWMIKPENFDASKKYPVLVFVYGEPAAQTVADHWGGEQELFHRHIAKEGYVVVSVDNRGTPAPRGREWLIVHSPDDDNVHYQGTELLINRLVELGKPFDFMEYPDRTHSLSEGEGTHYHVFSLLARYLEEHLPPASAASASH
jgi:dipeptidyl aminopeptidase/acylaminoacyl peptidase